MPAGASQGRAVVFIHGIGGSARVWAPQIASFSAAGLVPEALDLPGYGGRPPVEAMSFDGLAADVEAAIADAGLEQPILLGHSMGGMVAQVLLRRQPGSYRAAVLCCTSPAFGSSDGTFQQKFVADRLGPLEAGKTMADLAPVLVDRMIGPSANSAGRAFAIEVMSAVPAGTYGAAVRCLVGFDERANLPGISVPVLCLAGEKDPNAPAAGMERMAAKIPGSRYICLRNAGHLPNLEDRVAFDAAVLGFLAALPPPRTDLTNP